MYAVNQRIYTTVRVFIFIIKGSTTILFSPYLLSPTETLLSDVWVQQTKAHLLLKGRKRRKVWNEKTGQLY